MMEHVVVNLRAFQQCDQALEFEALADDGDENILEATFKALNCPPDMVRNSVFGTLGEASVIAYHKEHPSLSVGDEVRIGGRAYRCEGAGWRRVADLGPSAVALRDLVTRCDGPEGMRPDGSNIDTLGAHAALGDLRDLIEDGEPPTGMYEAPAAADERWVKVDGGWVDASQSPSPAGADDFEAAQDFADSGAEGDESDSNPD